MAGSSDSPGCGREGGLDAPLRRPIDWTNPDFYDAEKLDAELRRVFDICHGCRRCFNLCDSFPRLFDLIDESESGELDTVKSKDFKPVIDACTLCDMCFMVSCPYVPPHAFDLDFPHLMLRARAVEQRQGKGGGGADLLAETDRNGKLAGLAPGLVNWASDRKNAMARGLLEKAIEVHKDAALPRFHGKTLALRAKSEVPPVDAEAPAAGRKAVIYATCLGNYNAPEIGLAARAVLAKNGVETEVAYPGCCAMPRLEQGRIDKVAEAAKRVARDLGPWIDRGYDVIALVPSCALMLKFEWPLILPEDPAVAQLAKATYDVSEYIVGIAKKEGLAPGLTPLDGGVAVHIACHARAQNMGHKAAELLRLIPEADLKVVERCSGHGGAWGIMKDNFPVAMKLARTPARQAAASGKTHLASECPLAGRHLVQAFEAAAAGKSQTPAFDQARHPIEIFAKAYGLT